MRERWEYREVELFKWISMNDYGKDGWELVTILPSTPSHYKVAVFKRKIRST